jgi:hypothetical protein
MSPTHQPDASAQRRAGGTGPDAKSMDDVNWLQSCIAENDEMASQARRFLRVVQEYRTEIAGLWADSAGRYVRDRFLVPHEAQAASLLELLVQHSSKIAETRAELEQADRSAAAADRLSFEIDRLLEETILQLRRANDSIERSANAASRSRSAAASAESLIRQADAFGP